MTPAGGVVVVPYQPPPPISNPHPVSGSNQGSQSNSPLEAVYSGAQNMGQAPAHHAARQHDRSAPPAPRHPVPGDADRVEAAPEVEVERGLVEQRQRLVGVL